MSNLGSVFDAYIACWALACLVALALYVRHPGGFAVSLRGYRQLLSEPWKLATFVAGAASITLIAPFAGDPTWDRVDGCFMSVLCFLTAPWVVAVLFRAAHRRTGWQETYVAVCAGLFSASWSYDIYLVWRDGEYPLTWHSNLFASSVIYLCAGLFWNLEWHPQRGVIFSFMREGWPSRPEVSSPLRLAFYAAVFAFPAIAAVWVFLA